MTTGSSILVLTPGAASAGSLRVCFAAGDYEIAYVDTAEAALDAIATGRSPDVLVLDLAEIDAAALALCQLLRSSVPQIPILVVAVYAEIGERVAALDAGARDVVAGVYASPELLARIRAIVRRAGYASRPAETAESLPGRPADVRVGSNPERFAPVSMCARSFRPSQPSWLVFLTLVAAFVIVDLLTKQLVEARLSPGEAIGAFRIFSFVHVDNSGTAFGFLAGYPYAIGLVGLLFAVLLVAWFWRSGGQPRVVLPIALLCGGALGNVSERLAAGGVTDFLTVAGLPSFNLADVFVLAGIASLLASRMTTARA